MSVYTINSVSINNGSSQNVINGFSVETVAEKIPQEDFISNVVSIMQHQGFSWVVAPANPSTFVFFNPDPLATQPTLGAWETLITGSATVPAEKQDVYDLMLAETFNVGKLFGESIHEKIVSNFSKNINFQGTLAYTMKIIVS